MLDVACGAVRGINLFRVMDGAIVAAEASGVSCFRGKCAGSSQVASSALFFQHRVRFAHAAAGIDAIIAGKAAP